MTRGFSLKSPNEKLQVAQFLAKPPDRRLFALAEDEKAAAATHEERERAGAATLGIGQLAAAGVLAHRFPHLVAGGHRAQSDNFLNAL